MGERLKILVVDDDADIRTIARLSLGLDPEIDVETAATPSEAVAKLAFAIDAILLDVMMPEMDGPALASKIRCLPAHGATPILFMTARARAADIALYRTLGAAGVIVKPFDPLSLATEVRSAIGARRG